MVLRSKVEKLDFMDAGVGETNPYTFELASALPKALFIYIEKELHEDVKVFIASKSSLDHFQRIAGKTFREATRTSRVASNNWPTKSTKDEGCCVLWVYNDDKIRSRDGNRMRRCRRRKKRKRTPQ